MSYFDNLGRDLGVYTIFSAVVTLGRQGTHYELLVIPAVYVVVGIFVDIRGRRRERMQPINQSRGPVVSRASTIPVEIIVAPATKPKPHIRLKHPDVKSELSELGE